MIISHRMAYVGLFSRLSIHRIPSRSRWYHGRALANSISMQQVCVFSQCQSGLLVGRRDACWWVLSGWFPGCRIGPGDAACRWYLPSRFWPVVLLWAFGLARLSPKVLAASILCPRCWLYKDLRRLAPLVGHSRNDGVEVGRKFHRWGLDIGAMAQKGWDLLS